MNELETKLSELDLDDKDQLKILKNYYDSNSNYGFSSKNTYDPVDDNNNSSTSLSPSSNNNTEKNTTETNNGRDWNEEFQTIFDMSTSDPERPTLLGKFGQEFMQEVSKTAQTIIDELSLQDTSLRTIKPVDIGGIAGGTKYIILKILLTLRFIHNGILYKMAVDHNNMYQSEESPMKIAGHEFRGCIWMSLVEDLRLPLSCMVDYCGMRITANARLPISPQTLVVGSSNASQTIHNESSPHFNRAQELCYNLRRQLNWKEHLVEEQKTGQMKSVFGPVDMEVPACRQKLTLRFTMGPMEDFMQ